MKRKLEGNKRAEKSVFTQTGQLYDKLGQPLPKVPNMVGNCVGLHRQHLLPIKTIYLCPVYYHSFRDWFRKLCTEREADLKHELLMWDGVEIEMMGQFHIIKAKTGTEAIDWDYYEQKTSGNA